MYDNYNEVYSWSELKTFISPDIDEGKGITIQKSSITQGTHRTLIANNIAFSNGFSGVHLNVADNVDIVGNTVVNNHRTGRGNNVGVSISDGSRNKIINNLVVSTNSFGGAALNVVGTGVSNTVISNNAIYGTSSAAGISVTGTVTTDPKFAGWLVASTALPANTTDFHLSGSSPAINAGVAFAGVTTDFAGIARGSPPDIGAYEY